MFFCGIQQFVLFHYKCIGVALNMHIMHLCKENICNLNNQIININTFSTFITGAALEGKNLLPEGANSFL